MKMDIDNRFDNTELEKSKPRVIVEVLECVPNSVLTKTIIKKPQVTSPFLLKMNMTTKQTRLATHIISKNF